MSVVKGAKGRAVTNAEQGRPRKPITQQTVKARFRFLVHCRGRFVEEKPIRRMHESAGKGNALLLTGRELKCPVGGLVKSAG